MKQNKIDKSIHEVKLLINYLKLITEETNEEILYFEHLGLGSLHLNYEGASRYRECLRNLVENSVKDDDLSLKTVEGLFQEALLEAFYLEESSASIDLKINDILEGLKQKLTAKRIPYCCYIPVCGINSEGLPLSMGKIKIAVFDDLLVDTFEARIVKHSIQREFKWIKTKEKIDSSFYKKIVGIVTVEAKDYNAAEVIAIKNLREVLDILNFFSMLVPYNPDAWTYLSGDLEPYFFESIILNEDDTASFNIMSKRIGPLQEINVLRIIESSKKDNIGFDYVINLLTKNNLNKFQQSLLTAIQWAGRAVVANRREEAFLLYAIALESIILVDSPNSELSYRLRLRISHLITSNLKNRNEVANTVKELYNLRSKIVHDGKYEISSLELDTIKYISISCIKRLCVDPLFRNMASPKDFADWLEDRILS